MQLAAAVVPPFKEVDKELQVVPVVVAIVVVLCLEHLGKATMAAFLLTAMVDPEVAARGQLEIPILKQIMVVTAV